MTLEREISNVDFRRRRVLELAAELVERGWCQGTSARDASGAGVIWDSRKAVAWCAEGAIAAAVGFEEGRRLRLPSAWDRAEFSACQTLLALELRARGVKTGPQKWNDAPERTAAEVAEVLRAAVAHLPAPSVYTF